MAFTWANTFVAANAVSGMSSGNQTAIDEWPWTSDVCYIQNTSLGTGTVTFTFDMSAGPGDKKGFWVWFRSHVDNANGYSITETRLTDGTTTLWTDSSPGITVTETTFASSEIRVFRIPDSAFSTDPTISGLVLEFDVANLNAGNNRFRFSGMRMSKSPFTAAQETDVPSSLSGADFSCYIASDLAVLGAADAEAVVVWPDSSGNGRHLIRKTGTTSLYETDTPDYVSFPSGGGSIFFGHWGTRVTGNHIWHTYIYPEDTTTTQGVWSYNSSFAGVVDPATDPNDKNILGIDDEGSGDKFLLMSGDGSAGAHKYGATTVTFEAWVRVTEWIQDSGNEHLWLNDDASPDVDAASGSNNMLTVTVGNRESEDRPFQGRMAEFWWIDGGSFTETNIDDARDVWVNGAGGTPGTVTPAAISAALTIPASSAAGPAVTQPAATSAALTVPASTPSGGGVVTPAATSAALTIPAATFAGPAVTRPASTSLNTVIPAAAPAGGAVVAPAATALTLSVPAVSPVGGGVATPAQIGLTLAVPAVTLAGGGVVTPAQIGLVLSVPAVTVLTGGAATVTPDTISAGLTIPASTPAGGGTVTPDAISAVLALLAPSVAGGATVTFDPITATLTIPASTPVGGAVTTPNVVSAVLTIPGVTVSGAAGPTPGSIYLTVVIPGVSLSNTDATPDTQEGELAVTFQEGGLSVTFAGGGLVVSEQSSSLKVSQ